MTAADVPTVVAIHVRAFPGFFLSFLGPAFLGLLYHGIVDDPTGLAFVAEQPGRGLAGFVAGTTAPAGLYTRLLRRQALGFAVASVPALLRRPTIAPRLVRALAMPSRAALPAGAALLMSLAVDSGVQRGGHGRALVAAFLSGARAAGATAVHLTTDRDQNEAVNAFYRGLGFRLHRHYRTPEGRDMNEYVGPAAAGMETNA
jgi:ribosomal protein S18 acetylase RimI-like enzyme